MTQQFQAKKKFGGFITAGIRRDESGKRVLFVDIGDLTDTAYKWWFFLHSKEEIREKVLNNFLAEFTMKGQKDFIKWFDGI